MVFISSSLLTLATVLTTPLVNGRPSKQLQHRRAGNGPIDGWTFYGCYTDDTPATGRTLHGPTDVNSTTMTPAVCTTFCQGDSRGFAFAGTEYASECYCDFNIQGTAKKVNDTECNMPCAGDDSLTCGAGGRLSVYIDTNGGPVPSNKNVGNWTFKGCHTDAVNGDIRTLTERFDIPGGVTIESCTAECTQAGFTFPGLEFGQECWCGNSVLQGTGAPNEQCSMACNADHTELCGASYRLSVYAKSA